MITSALKTTAIVLLCLSLFSCAVVVVEKKDNGKHRGWTKNTNNPHHPHSTNPGKGHSSKNPGKGHSKKKGK